MRRQEWSLSQRRFTYGIEDHFSWVIKACLNDGHCVWRGRFLDREDADAFLFAALTGSLDYERELWRLPTPEYPGSFEYPVTWYVVTNVVLSTGAGAGNQTFNRPADYVVAGSLWYTVGAGGGGGAFYNTGGGGTFSAAGGGGAAFNQITNLTLGSTAIYNIPVGALGGAISSSVSVAATGSTGADCWFNGTTLGGSSVGSKGGLGGGASIVTAASNGGLGGVAASGVGAGNNGGRGGNTSTGNNSRSGGGGAGGPNAAGNQAPDITTGRGAGGQGDGTFGGAAGATTGSGVGGTGTEFGDGATGSGGGGSGSSGTLGTGASGPGGGLYGGGGGAAMLLTTGAVTLHGGPGAQGVVFGQYTPVVVATTGFANMPMLGM